jgi:potassium-dependent mechanosensitive channel
MSFFYRLFVAVCFCAVLTLHGGPGAAHGQGLLFAREGEAVSPTSPLALPAALREAENALKKETSSLRSRSVGAGESLNGIRQELNALAVEVASLKAFMAIRELPVTEQDVFLKDFEARDSKAGETIKTTQDEIQGLQSDQARIGASLESVKKQVPHLRKASPREEWSQEMEEAVESYLRTAAGVLRSVERLIELSQSKLQLLQEERKELSGILPQLRDSVETWRAELLKRQEKLPLSQELAEIWKTVSALPLRIKHYIVGLIQSGRLASLLKAHPDVLPGLIVFMGLLLWATRRLNGIMLPRFQLWKSHSPELSVRAFFSLAEILFSLLFPIGVTVWIARTLYSLGLLQTTPAILTLCALGALVAFRFSSRVVKSFFGKKNARGLLPLDEETARFYRRNLRRLLGYVVAWVSCLIILETLGFPPMVQQLLGYFFEVGLLVWTLSLLRRKYFDRLPSDISAPGHRSWAHWLTAARGTLIVVLVSIVLTYLLGFQRLSTYMASATAQTVGVLALFWLLSLTGKEFLHYGLHSCQGWVGQRFPDRVLVLERICTLSQQAYNSLLAVAALLLSLYVWGVGPALLFRAFEWITWDIDLGPVHLSVLNLTLSVLVVYSGFWLSRFVTGMLQLRVFPRSGWDIGIQYTISAIMQYVIVIVAALVALTILGFPLANLALIMGALGVGIGLGLQNIVANFVSGLVLLIERPIKVKDMLVIDGQWGEVRQIRIRSTVFQTFDGSVIIIPNSDLTSNKILNWTHYGRGASRITLSVGVSYEANVREVTELLLALCRSNPRVLDTPGPNVYFQAYGESSLDFTVMVHVRAPEDRLPATHELNTAVFEAFREHRIEIPFPQRELTIRNWPPGLSEERGKTG